MKRLHGYSNLHFGSDLMKALEFCHENSEGFFLPETGWCNRTQNLAVLACYFYLSSGAAHGVCIVLLAFLSGSSKLAARAGRYLPLRLSYKPGPWALVFAASGGLSLSWRARI